jgi:hypothetical protein
VSTFVEEEWLDEDWVGLVDDEDEAPPLPMSDSDDDLVEPMDKSTSFEIDHSILELFHSDSESEKGDDGPVTAPVDATTAPSASSGSAAGPVISEGPGFEPEEGESQGGVASSQPIERGPIGKANAVAFVPGGKISYYASKQDIEAFCTDPRHGKCVLTRRMTGAKQAGRLGQGRPLGLATAWLAKGSECATKEDHKLAALTLSKEERAAGRLSLQAISGSDVSALFANERPCDADEGEEPDVIW